MTNRDRLSTKIAVPDRGNTVHVPESTVATHRLVVSERERTNAKLAEDFRIIIPPRVSGATAVKNATLIALVPLVEPAVAPQLQTEVAPEPIIRRKLALLLPGHNEELIIASTIASAIASGQDIKDIYVVDDNSSDDTRKIAVEKLGEDHVLSVERSGKALAVKKAVDHFHLDKRYIWLHVADADSIFSQNYFREYVRKLDEDKYAVAVGFVQSLRGNWISTYRALTYTYGQHVTRRAQSYVGMVSVFPGPVTCFRTDVLSKLEFGNESLTEDFDITLQVHRKNLGKILYVPKAVNYTQDPQTLGDFCKQSLRWQRGFFQGVKKYRIGLRKQRIDISLGLQMIQTPIFLLEIFVLVPLFIALTGNWLILPTILAIEIIINSGIALATTALLKRWNMIGALPYFFFLRFLEIGIHIMAFVEVMILNKFSEKTVGWTTEGRRYELSKMALSDVAK